MGRDELPSSARLGKVPVAGTELVRSKTVTFFMVLNLLDRMQESVQTTAMLRLPSSRNNAAFPQRTPSVERCFIPRSPDWRPPL